MTTEIMIDHVWQNWLYFVEFMLSVTPWAVFFVVALYVSNRAMGRIIR